MVRTGRTRTGEETTMAQYLVLIYEDESQLGDIRPDTVMAG